MIQLPRDRDRPRRKGGERDQAIERQRQPDRRIIVLLLRHAA
jgi:hypothetical protein